MCEYREYLVRIGCVLDQAARDLDGKEYIELLSEVDYDLRERLGLNEDDDEDEDDEDRDLDDE